MRLFFAISKRLAARRFRCVAALLAVSFLTSNARAVTLEQTISRETPLHDNASAEMTVGRDGMVYLSSRAPGQYNGYVVRMTREGTQKTGGDSGAATGNVAVNDKGILAAGNQHFTAAVGLYDREFNRIGEVKEFKAWTPEFGESSGYNVPNRVLAAPSGDFYALDVFRDNIVRVSPQGRVLQKYLLPRDGTGINALSWDFRLDEKNQTFYTRSRELNAIRAVGFDGAQKWKATLDTSGGWDVGGDGTIYAVSARSDSVQKMSGDGKSAGAILLKGEIAGEGDWKNALGKYPITGLNVWDGEILIKRAHPTEMLARFELASGVLRRAVMADFETFKVSYPSETWTAGGEVDFQIAHTDPILNSKPQWHVWARGLSTPDYREWKVVGGKLQVPADAAGLIQIKVSPEVQPLLRGETSEYLLQSWVEVRSPNSRGTANLWTSENRAYFARGEAIPFSILLRGANLEAAPLPVAVRLRTRNSVNAASANAVAEFQTTIKPGTLSPFKIESSLTHALMPGDYILEASTPGLTTIAQPLVIGNAPREDYFQLQYGDYQHGFFPILPAATAWATPDLVAAHVARLKKLSVNLVVERVGIGNHVGEVSSAFIANQMAPLRARLEADALGVAPEKALHAPALLQTMGALGASGVSQMPILLYMDAAIPIGSAPQADGRQFPKLAEDITTVTNGLKPYPAFRGWSWVANWWVWDATKRYANDAEKTAYEAALKTARETGVWNEVLDTVGNRRFSFGVEAEQKFRAVLKNLAPEKVSALSGPYRSVDTFPPLSFAGADEVDLHYQAEQIQPPYATWHNVDYQKRPGKIAWGHPELWNDSGTGDMIATNLFGMAMRGADGVGVSGTIPDRRIAFDARASFFGTTSVYRATFKTFERLGPWLRTLENNDRVAIVASTRMAKIDDWKGVGGEYFSRLFEAYQSCLFAHRPASFVFAEDLKPGTLSKYDAVLVVGQTVEIEPVLKNALNAVKAKVFYDATCRADLVREWKPLGTAFDNVTKDQHVWQDDAAYPRFSAYMKANAPVVRRALSSVLPPAQLEARDVLLTERRAENARYIWVLNTAMPEVDPGAFWKTNKFISSRAPQSATLTLNAPAPGATVYDVFAQKIVAAPAGKVQLDLRTLPARLFAVLPAAIDRVALRGPAAASPGQNLKWWIQARDREDKSIAASVPMRVRLLDGAAIIEERHLACGGAGASGVLRLPLGVRTPILEATELLSGKSARLNMKIAPREAPALNSKNTLEDAPAGASGESTPAGSTPDSGAVENDFGVRLRDVVVSQSGDTALVSAMSWDENLYALDLATGKTKWKKRVGEQWATSPRALANGFAVEGVDFENGGGDHLYLASGDGNISRRFALHNAAKGGVNWAWAGILYDRSANFAVAQGGEWIASAGDLGIVVWDKTGKMLWQKPGAAGRLRAVATAQGGSTLVVGQGATATAFDAKSGAQKWQMSLSANGAIREIVSSLDGKTLAISASSDGGRVFIVRDGKLAATFVSKADEMTLSQDGSTLALTTGNILKIYNGAGGLRWSYGGDDALHFPRISQGDKRIVVSSELGTTTVLNMDGTVLQERDLESLAAPAWLPNGDLILAGWNGEVRRVDANFKTVWRARVQPSQSTSTETQIPTARVSVSNADAKAAPLAPNLLADTKAIITAQSDGKSIIEWKNDAALLSDGKPDAPASPWLSWSDIGMIESGWRGELSLVFDTFRTQLRVKAITFVEDPKNPQSWLRDANLEYWDAATEKWRFAANLLADAPVHTHTLPRPIEAAKFRLVKSPTAGIWPIGNVRWGEVVFHGEQIGASHPDSVARKPLAVLFDEGDDLKAAMTNLDYKLDDAFSGGRSLQVQDGKPAFALFTPPWGHALPNWNFPIRENPKEGEYRWLQFAWKATSPQTTGVSLLIGNPWPGGGVNVVAGTYEWGQGVLVEKKIEGGPPQQWKTTRVDLWDALKKPIDLQSLSLASNGGGAAFDQIVLGKTEADLPPQK